MRTLPPWPAAGRRGLEMRGLWAAGWLVLAGCAAETIEPARIGQAKSEPALLTEGRDSFRHETFGSEQFFGDTLGLHRTIAGAANGGTGPGLSPRAAVALGLKLDAQALPAEVLAALAAGRVDLEDPAVTLLLLQLDAVVGVKGFFEEGQLASVGITCALCHSTVDDALAFGLGLRLDGWPNRDLDLGSLLGSAPDLSFFADALGVDEAAVRQVFASWGPGRYDALLVLDGKAFRDDGSTAAVLLPAAFGLAGVSLATYTGFGDVTYWNAYVATTQMHGVGTFYDPRLLDPEKYPVAAHLGLGDLREAPDRVTPKLAGLHLYQLTLEAPSAPAGTYDAAAAERGRALFEGKAGCARCHVPPLYTEPGHGLHTPEEIGIDAFHASRSPTGMYRTTPLRGLFTRSRGGFYHDGRFADLPAVVDHYDAHFGLGLARGEKADLVEFLRSL